MCNKTQPKFLILACLFAVIFFTGFSFAISLTGLNSSYSVGDTVSITAKETVGGDASVYNYCEFIFYKHWDGPLSDDTEGNTPFHKNKKKNVSTGTKLTLDYSFTVLEEMLDGKSSDDGEFQIHVYCDSDEIGPGGGSKSWYGPWKIKTWTAENGGCDSDNDCKSDEICKSNECVEVECKKDSQCPSDSDIGSPECSGNILKQKYKDYYCADAGKIYASCDYEYKYKTVQDCGLPGCSNGQCNPKPACYSDSDCPADGYIGSQTCLSDDVQQQYTDYYCENPGKANAQCKSTTSYKKIYECGTKGCSNNTCNECIVNSDCGSKKICTSNKCVSVTCKTNSECGTNSWLGNPVCKTGDVYQDFKTYTCNNAGNVNAYCSNATSNLKKEDCGSNECKNGACVLDCKINSAYWSTSIIDGGKNVTLSAEASYCNNQTLTFSIFEDDLIGDDFIITKEKTVLDNKASLNWWAQYFADWWADPEFYFLVMAKNGANKKSSNLKVTEGGSINFKDFDTYFSDKPIVIIKGTNLSQKLLDAISDLKNTIQKKNGNVSLITAAFEADNCYIPEAYSASLIVIGNENNNKAYACSPKDADHNSGMYFKENPWSESGAYGVIWINTLDSDGTYDNLVSLDKMFSMGVNDNMNLWDSSVACIWNGDFEKAASPFKEELSCNMIPVVELAPDVRDVWNYCGDALKGAIGKNINDWDADTLINNFMCRFVVGMFVYDVAGLAADISVIFGLAEVAGDSALSSFKIALKTVIKNSYDTKKEVVIAALKAGKQIPEVMPKLLKVIRKAPAVGQEMAEAVIKTFSHGSDVAKPAVEYMGKNADVGWTPKAVNGMGYLYKMNKEYIPVSIEKTTVYSTKLAPNSAKLVVEMFEGGAVTDEIKTIRNALGSGSNKNIEFVFGEMLTDNGQNVEKLLGKTVKVNNDFAIFFKGKKPLNSISDDDYKFILRYRVITHELGEEQLLLQTGNIFDGYPLINNNDITEHFAESLLITRANLGKGSKYADAFGSSTQKLIPGGISWFAKDKALAAVSNKNLGLVAQEYATAVKIENTQYANELITQMRAALKEKYPQITNKALDFAENKVKLVSEDISSVGNAIANNPQLKEGSPALKGWLDSLENKIKSLNLKSDVIVTDIDIFKGSIVVDATVKNDGLENAENVKYVVKIDSLVVANGVISLGVGEEAHIIEVFKDVQYGDHSVEVIVDSDNKIEELDENNNNKTKDFIQTINGVNAAPEIKNVQYSDVYAGEKVVIIVGAEDDVQESLNYYINSKYFSTNGNELSWQTKITDAGIYPLTIIVSDGELTDTENIVLNVQCKNGVDCVKSKCNSNLDCGVDELIGDNFCLNNGVYNVFMKNVCNNPGKKESYCSLSFEDKKVETCAFGCENKSCIKPACISDEDCPEEEIISLAYCLGHDIYKKVKKWSCTNPGTNSAECKENIQEQKLESCGFFGCNGGQCVEEKNIACFSAFSCPSSSYVGSAFCSNNAVYQKYQFFSCEKAGTLNSYCLAHSEDKLVKTCSATEFCDKGACEKESCLVDSDCGINTSVGGLFCKDGSVYQKYKSYSCNKFGGAGATCTNVVQDKLKLICKSNETCLDGECKSIKCNTNLDCGTNTLIENPSCVDGDVYQKQKTFTCLNPSTINASCSVTVKQVLVTDCGNTPCTDGQCLSPKCNKNSDCGVNGYVGDNFCLGGNAYKKLKIFTCINPGTFKAECIYKISDGLVDTCSAKESCVNGNCLKIECYGDSDCGSKNIFGSPYCKDGNVYQLYKQPYCSNPGTINAKCVDQNVEQLNFDCPEKSICDGGICHIVPCMEDLDCGSKLLMGSAYCLENKIFQKQLAPTCADIGTTKAHCINMSQTQLIENCGADKVCDQGKCNPFVCTLNADCGLDGPVDVPFCFNNKVYQQYKQYLCNKPNTINAYCTNSMTTKVVEDCGLNKVCNNGACSAKR